MIEDTEFGLVGMVCVGSTMVGSIELTSKQGKMVKKYNLILILLFFLYFYFPSYLHLPSLSSLFSFSSFSFLLIYILQMEVAIASAKISKTETTTTIIANWENYSWSTAMQLKIQSALQNRLKFPHKDGSTQNCECYVNHQCIHR